MKKNKGITLIALVITIIVLLILAMVSIAILTGDNGILTQAINAEEENEKAAAEEKLRLALIEYRAQKYTDNKELKEFLENHKDISSVEGDTAPYTVIVDGYQVEVDANGEYNENNFQLAGPRPQVENILITTDGTTEPADGSLTEGTTVQINFDTSIEGGTIKSISPQLPYTTNGTDKEIEFTIVGTVNGVDYTLTKKVSVVHKYIRPPETLEEALQSSTVMAFSETENVTISDDYGNDIVVPAGFGIAKDSGVDVIEGIVIEDEINGNQFVWIPVGNINNDGTTVNIELSRYEFAEDGTATKKGLQDYVQMGGYKFSEEETSTLGNIVAKNLGEFIATTEISGGYYIARYESSNAGGVAASVRNKASWKTITQPAAATLARNMYQETIFTSDLINSLAWDTAIVYIQTFSEYKDYSKQTTVSMSSTSPNTGMADDEKLKITDMSSGVMEWTTETCTHLDYNYPATIRGGVFNTRYNTVDGRNAGSSTLGDPRISFRAILYL